MPLHLFSFHPKFADIDKTDHFIMRCERARDICHGPRSEQTCTQPRGLAGARGRVSAAGGVERPARPRALHSKLPAEPSSPRSDRGVVRIDTLI